MKMFRTLILTALIAGAAALAASAKAGEVKVHESNVSSRSALSGAGR